MIDKKKIASTIDGTKMLKDLDLAAPDLDKDKLIEELLSIILQFQTSIEVLMNCIEELYNQKKIDPKLITYEVVKHLKALIK